MRTFHSLIVLTILIFAQASVVMDKQGAVLLADDVGNRIWRVTPDAPH